MYKNVRSPAAPSQRFPTAMDSITQDPAREETETQRYRRGDPEMGETETQRHREIENERQEREGGMGSPLKKQETEN